MKHKATKTPDIMNMARQLKLRNCAHGMLAAMICELVARFRGFLLMPLLVKNLDIAEYGLYVQVTVVIGVGAVIGGLHTQRGLVRFLPSLDSPKERASYLYAAMAFHMIGSIILVPAICGLVSVANPSLAPLILVLGLLIIAEMFGELIIQYRRATENWSAFALASNLRVIVTLLVVGFSAYQQASLPTILWRWLAANSVLYMAMGIILLAKLPLPQGIRGNGKKLFVYSVPLIFWGMAWWIMELSDRLIIGRLLGDDWVGYYHPAYMLGMILMVVPRLLGAVLPPVIARVYDQGEKDTVRFVLSLYWKILLVIGVPFAALCVVMQRDILLLLTKASVAEHALWIAPIIAISTIFLGGSAVFGEVLKLRLRPGYAAKVWVIAAVINVLINLCFIKTMGIMAAALSTVCAFLFGFFCLYAAAHRHLGISLQLRTLVICCAGCVPMISAWYLISPTGLASSTAICGTGLLVYGAFVTLTGVVRPRYITSLCGKLLTPATTEDQP